jgi:hypothetical protein
MIVTIAVGSERYRVRLVDRDDLDIARRLVTSADPATSGLPTIPNGLLVEGTDVNTGYPWHIDPTDFVWAELALQECDGHPSQVGPGFQSDRFCPSSARVVAVDRP